MICTTAFQPLPLGIPKDRVHELIQSMIQNLVGMKDTSGEFMLRLNDGSIVDSKGWNGWEWTHGIGLFGLWQYFEVTRDTSVLVIIETWFKDRLAEPPRHKNVNTVAVFYTMACVYEHTHNKFYLPHLQAWADWALYELERTEYGGMQHVTYLSSNTQQLRGDTLMMAVLFIAKFGKMTRKWEYVDEAKRQFMIHIKYLFHKKTGLFYHGWTFEDGGHNIANVFWARGNSWLTIAIPEIVELLQFNGSHPLKYHLTDCLTAQIKTLSKYQDKSGLWRTLIDEDSYLEASATAGFAYGILKAIRKRYIDPEYKDVALKAIKGIIDNISPDGELKNVSFSTPMGDTKQSYKDVLLTSMPYGQAMGIMALIEYLRLYM